MGSYNWNWPILLKEPYFGWIVTGFGKTILIAVLAWAIAFPLGSAIGIARTADNRVLRFAGTALRRHLPQHPAAGADVPLVLRRARAAAGGPGAAGSSATCPIRSS